MMMRAIATSVALFLQCTAVLAGNLYTIGIPGQGWPCNGVDGFVMFMPPAPIGAGCPSTLPPAALACVSTIGVGGPWPTSDFTIWSTNYSVNTDDTKADSVVGILGSSGDSITPDIFGRAWVRQVEPGAGRIFHVATDRIDLHVKCASGYSVSINAQFEITSP